MRRHVHANPDHLERLARDVRTCADDINDAIRKLQKAAKWVDWNDDKHTEFERKLHEATSTGGRTSQQLKALEEHIHRKVAELRTYLAG